MLKNISKSVVAVVLPLGAHHLDLMFPTDADPPSAPKPVPAANSESWASSPTKTRIAG